MATTTKRGLNKPDRADNISVITAINNNMDNLDDAVPDSRKVNGKALSSDVTIDDTDLPIIAGKIASTQAMIAQPFVEATPNAAGSYVTNAGALYYLPDGHTANATWANTTKTEVKAGSELTNLKSAVENVYGGTTYNLYRCINTTQTINGVKITTDIANNVIVSGTGSANGGRTLLRFGSTTFPAGTYYFSVTDIGSPTVSIILTDSTTATVIWANSSFTLNEQTDLYLVFNVVKNTTYNQSFRVQVSTTQGASIISPITAVDIVARNMVQYKTPQFYGAVGNGTADDTNSIQSAIDNSAIVYIPNGTYMINDTGITVTSNKTIILSNGTVIQKSASSNSHYGVINIAGNNVHICGGKILGDKLTHTGDTTDEHGHCIDIEGNNVLIENCTIGYAQGDGIYIGGTSTNPANNIVIDSCIFDNDNYRNCISVINSDNFTIKNNLFSGITGLLVDVEPNLSTHKTKGTIIDNRSIGCNGVLAAFNYVTTITDVSVSVNDWISMNDTSESAHLFYVRVPGGATRADGYIMFDGLKIINGTASNAIFARRAIGDPTKIKIGCNNMAIEGGTYDDIIKEQVDSPRSITSCYDLFTTFVSCENLVKTVKGPDATSGTTTINVYMRGTNYQPSDVSTATGDIVNLYAMQSIS